MRRLGCRRFIDIPGQPVLSSANASRIEKKIVVCCENEIKVVILKYKNLLRSYGGPQSF